MDYKLNRYPRLPEELICITTYFDDEDEYFNQFGEHHYAVDMAYTSRWQGGTKYVRAADDGVIKWRQDATGTAANALRIEHYGLIDGKTVHTRYFHMSEIAKGMTVGKEVKKGEIIGIEGRTGNATGPHLHFEFLVCPTDYKFKSAEVYKYAVDPLKYCFLYPDQKIGYDPKNQVRTLLNEYEKLPLEKGSRFVCLRSNALYYRSAPETVAETKLGFLPEGGYAASYTVENGGYEWVSFELEGKEVFAAVYNGLSYIEAPIDYEKLYNEELLKNKELAEQNEVLKAEAEAAKASLSEMTEALKVLRKY
ncbi:MAG: M23 family metallopeptidase [Clostridia bacterium]|nr:M23 family metallopeptidase [Clostridia bacterium]